MTEWKKLPIDWDEPDDEFGGGVGLTMSCCWFDLWPKDWEYFWEFFGFLGVGV